MQSAPLDQVLAVYGTLGPGQDNHYEVSMLRGEWSKGVVRGYEFPVGWGPAEGYPGFVADPDGNAIDVDVLVSADLPKHWNRLDHFEGPGYRRISIDVWADGLVVATANIYEALTDIDD